MNERINNLRQQALTTSIVSDPEADRLWSEGWAEAADEPDLIRDAKVFAYYCQHRAISIRDDELIVGARPGIRYEETMHRPVLLYRQRFDAPDFPVPDESVAFFRHGVLSMAGNHTAMDYDSIMQGGLEALIARAEQRKKRLNPDEPDAGEKGTFLDALARLGHGHVDLCRRYGDLAEEMASQAESPQRRQELARIADQCRRVPALPPRTFWEACQCLWFCFLLVPDAPGRVDQYLYPFYRRDIESGATTRETAKELLSCLWLKYYENAGAIEPVGAVHHLTLGGVKPDGSDASNDVTWLCLEVTEELRLQRPQVGLRWNRQTPEDLLERAVRVLRVRCGCPDFSNDEQIVPALVRTGIALEDARDFSLSGCNEVIIAGKAHMGSVEGFVNMSLILRIVLGLEPALGHGEDLTALTSFDLLWDACETEMDRVAEYVHLASVARDESAANHPDLACSLTVKDCIENIRGYTQGGARYNHCNWDVVGVANLADSLAAIRKLVFEDGGYSLAELVEAMRSDWQGHEPLRLRIANECPHFGNDDDRVDLLAASVIETFSAHLKRRTPFRGGEYILGTLAGAENMHIEFGRVTGATPDGRRDGEPLADSMGAAQGRDRRGVTALLNSVAKLPHRLLPTASTLNVRLAPQLLDTGEGVARIAALIRGHFLAGGQQMQLNLVDRRMLLEAQENPDQHAGLMVRVAGYSAPFTSLWEDLQAEIISRTEHVT